MAYDINELLALPTNDRKEITADLMDSVIADEPAALPEWKIKLYKERLEYYKANPNDGIEWTELRKKYFPA